tara:strand:+ start:368 stop:1423 length:1056 start_codon:yes stop_codon:yes gene_type:complete
MGEYINILILLLLIIIILLFFSKCICYDTFIIGSPSKKEIKKQEQLLEDMYDDGKLTYAELCEAVPKYTDCNPSIFNKFKRKSKKTLEDLVHKNCNTGLIGRAYGIDGVLYNDWIRMDGIVPGISPPPEGSGVISKNMWEIMENSRPGWLDEQNKLFDSLDLFVPLNIGIDIDDLMDIYECSINDSNILECNKSNTDNLNRAEFKQQLILRILLVMAFFNNKKYLKSKVEETKQLEQMRIVGETKGECNAVRANKVLKLAGTVSAATGGGIGVAAAIKAGRMAANASAIYSRSQLTEHLNKKDRGILLGKDILSNIIKHTSPNSVALKGLKMATSKGAKYLNKRNANTKIL